MFRKIISTAVPAINQTLTKKITSPYSTVINRQTTQTSLQNTGKFFSLSSANNNDKNHNFNRENYDYYLELYGKIKNSNRIPTPLENLYLASRLHFKNRWFDTSKNDNDTPEDAGLLDRETLEEYPTPEDVVNNFTPEEIQQQFLNRTEKFTSMKFGK